MAKRRKEQEKAVPQARMDERVKAKMMAVLIRNHRAFEAVKDDLTPEHVKYFTAGHALAWRVVLDLYEEHSEMPSKDLLDIALQDAVTSDPDQLNDAELEELNEWIIYAYGESESEPINGDISNSRVFERWALDKVKRFHQEILYQRLRESVRSVDTVPSDLPEMLQQQADEAASIASLGHVRTADPYSAGWDRDIATVTFPTGLSCLDLFLNAGQASPEVYGLMGPFGSAKTTLAVQLLVAAANRFYRETHQEGWDGRRKVAYLVSYEAPMKEMRQRVLGCAARIHRSSIEKMTSIEDLSKGGQLLPYEQSMYAKQLKKGDKVYSEYARAQAAIRDYLNPHSHFLDMTGADPNNKGAGGGYVPEIARLISADLRRRGEGTQCGLIVIDYLGAMVDRYIEAQDKEDSETRNLLRKTALQIHNRLGMLFKCPTWLLHQLSGEANSRSAGADMHHTMGAECKSIAENQDFAFVLGNPTREGLCTLACTKHRRHKRLDTAVLRIAGDMYRTFDTNGEYCVDPHTRQIINKAEESQAPTSYSGHGRPAPATAPAMVPVNPMEGLE